jgi:hypothetical protein
MRSGAEFILAVADRAPYIRCSEAGHWRVSLRSGPERRLRSLTRMRPTFLELRVIEPN